jgi:nickel-dependent lactate racemase
VGALGILSAGGRIILVAKCSKGIGSSEFYRVLQDLHNIGDYGAFIRHISDPENFILDQWEAEMLVKALRRAKVSLFSAGIAEEDWHLTHADRIASVEEALSIAIAGATAHPRVAVIPEGPYVIPVNDNIMMGLMA